MSRGPAPTPIALRVLRGSRKSATLAKQEPRGLAFRDRPPADLDHVARKEWRRIGNVLVSLRVIQEADRHVLAELCRAISIKQQADEKLRTTGLITVAKSGYIFENPLLTISRKQGDTIIKLLREFGMTPSARARMATSDTPLGAGGEKSNRFAKYGA